MFPELHREAFEKDCEMTPEELVARIREVRKEEAIVDGKIRPALLPGERYDYDWAPESFPAQEV